MDDVRGVAEEVRREDPAGAEVTREEVYEGRRTSGHGVSLVEPVIVKEATW
ncbi:hypothetical protein [Actinomadura rubrisoli]|uniref:hypothetical protein n=1 Tax=Actinomadura rubrisoli TaxID=2530368 RepID=UPI001404A515|nr:hypothetical protein [Actinomadura rubrisoli]